MIKHDTGEVGINLPDLIKKYKEVKGIFLRYDVDTPFIVNGYDAVKKNGKELEMEIKNYLKIK